MATETVTTRLARLENRVDKMEARRTQTATETPPTKRGWRAFVGVDANNPQSKDAARLGREWRFADSPEPDEVA